MREQGSSNELSGTVHGNAFQIGSVETLNLLGAPPAPQVQWQVPLEVSGFVNRTREVVSMLGLLEVPAQTPSPRVLLLMGPPGVGKSELGRRFAGVARDRFPDGQLYVRLAAHRTIGGAVDMGEVYRVLLRSLGAAADTIPASTEDRARLYRATVHGRRILVVIDDADLAVQVRGLIPGADGAVLVTSQRRLEELRGGRTLALPVGPLDAGEGVALIAELVGLERVRAEPADAAALVGLCGGLPVALRAICAALVRRPRRSLADTVTGLRDEAARHRVLERGGVFAVFDESYAQLTASAAVIYRLIGMMPGPDTTPEALAATLGADPEQVEDGLDELIAANLLDELPDDRYAAHSLVRLHASRVAERTLGESEHTQLVRRTVLWYLACGQAADVAIAPVRLRLPAPATALAAADPGAGDVAASMEVLEFTDDQEGLAWLEGEHLALLDCVRTAAAHQWDAVVWLLCDPLWALYQNHKHYAEWIEVFGLALAAAERAEARWVGARLRCLLARAYIELAQFDQAARCLEPALAAARLEADALLEASVLEFTGIVALESGDPEGAMALFAGALTVVAGSAQTPDALRAALILRYLTGRALTAVGRPDQAAELLSSVYAQAVDGDPRLAGQVRFALAEALLNRGDPAHARELAAQAVAQAGRRGVPKEQARALQLLADCAAALGESAQADEYRARASAIYPRIEGPASADS